MMKIHCLIHANFEKPGYFETWANKHDFKLTTTQTHKGEILPSCKEFDMLLIMGGPQSPLQLNQFPYLRNEIKLIQQAMESDKHILGICLGAQLIGESLNVKTEPSPNKEIGVFPLTLTHQGKNDPMLNQLPSSFNAAHWHNDMPGIPGNAAILAESNGCPRQIIRFQPKVYGFQCHMEFTKKYVQHLIEHCPNDLIPGKYIQDAEAMVNEQFDKINQHLDHFLEKFLSAK